jgi:hypothetical protein
MAQHLAQSFDNMLAHARLLVLRLAVKAYRMSDRVRSDPRNDAALMNSSVGSGPGSEGFYTRQAVAPP